MWGGSSVMASALHRGFHVAGQLPWSAAGVKRDACRSGKAQARLNKIPGWPSSPWLLPAARERETRITGMRLSGMSLIGAAFAIVFCAGSALADELQRGGNVTCQGPFTNKQMGTDLLALYKSAARIEELSSLDGETFNSPVLFPDDPRARLEFDEPTGEGKGRLMSIMLKEKNSLWTIERLRTGMTPDELTSANGGPVTLSGFEQVRESAFAMLGWLDRGDCTVVVALYAPEGVRFEHPLYQKEVKSDDPRLAALNLTVDEIILQLPEPAKN
jgi:hypothetical protein